MGGALPADELREGALPARGRRASLTGPPPRSGGGDERVMPGVSQNDEHDAAT